MHGYFQQALTVDVSNRTSETEVLSEALLSACMGGKGLGTQLLLDRNPIGVDPFSPDNHLVFALGPATDSPLHGSCRHGMFA
ncbi:MAG: aldehyde:ferredoxin oxidoreductase, partial [Desulfosarcina sp.]|nr:aldehyde:ferredoxin oxidoreductase [Desulfosarcina sp.]